MLGIDNNDVFGSKSCPVIDIFFIVITFGALLFAAYKIYQIDPCEVQLLQLKKRMVVEGDLYTVVTFRGEEWVVKETNDAALYRLRRTGEFSFSSPIKMKPFNCKDWTDEDAWDTKQ